MAGSSALIKAIDEFYKLPDGLGQRIVILIYEKKLHQKFLSLYLHIAPVSYTHLDVYKRQEYGKRFNNDNKCI